ncbi:MAG: hypothetical protein AABY32_01370 [Nanoarchaeota archaeon]
MELISVVLVKFDEVNPYLEFVYSFDSTHIRKAEKLFCETIKKYEPNINKEHLDAAIEGGFYDCENCDAIYMKWNTLNGFVE